LPQKIAASLKLGQEVCFTSEKRDEFGKRGFDNPPVVGQVLVI
jgi:hypothetical protein